MLAVIVWPPIERERKQSRVFFSTKLLFIYTTGHKRERAKARDKKKTKEMFFVTKTTLEFYGGGEKFKKRNASDQQDENE